MGDSYIDNFVILNQVKLRNFMVKNEHELILNSAHRTKRT